MNNILRKPNPGPQTFVLTRTEREILYGGARGGGKTDAGIVWILRRIDNPNLRVLVLRHTYDDLVDWIDRAIQIYKEFGAEKKGVPTQIVFPSGATIRTGYLKGESYDKYKGHEYQKMIIEELTQIPSEDLYERILGSLRSTVQGLQPQMFLTTNPDGPGRLRVKRRFIDVAQPNTPYTDDLGNTRIYVPAKITDNPVLLEKDPKYIKYLQSIKDEQLRRAWLEGDWDAYDVQGGIYSSQLRQARAENRICNVPYEPNLPVYTAWDLGISDYMAIVIFQVKGKEIRIIDFILDEGYPIENYLQRIKQKGYTIDTHYLPHDANVRSRQTGRTDYDIFVANAQNAVILPRTSDIWTDINISREYFAYCWFNQNKVQTLLEHLEIYRKEFDIKLQVFKDRPVHGPESHSADAFRYCIMAYTQYLAITKNITKQQAIYDPITGQIIRKTENKYSLDYYKPKQQSILSKKL